MLSLVFVFMNFATAFFKRKLARHSIWLAPILLVVWVLLAGACRQTSSAPPQIQSQPNPAPKSSTTVRTDIGFASRQKFLDHYEKHGREFGSMKKEDYRPVSQQEYLRQAQELRYRQLDNSVLEAVRNDGVVTRFDKTTGAFLAFNADRIIRTYFKPNDGEAYFRRQSKRGSSRGGDNE